MKPTWLFWGALAVSRVALAGAPSGWLKYASAAEETWAIHMGRTHVDEDGVVSTWLRETFMAAQASKTPSGTFRWRVRETKMEFRCDDLRSRLLYIVLRKGDGDEAVVYSDGLGERPWSEILPGSDGEVHAMFACDHPPFDGWSTWTPSTPFPHNVVRKSPTVLRWEEHENTVSETEYDCRGKRWRFLYLANGTMEDGFDGAARAPQTWIPALMGVPVRDELFSSACPVPPQPAPSPPSPRASRKR